MALLGEVTGNLRTYPAPTKSYGKATQGTPVLSTATLVWRILTGADLQKTENKAIVDASYKCYSETAYTWESIRYEFEYENEWYEIVGKDKNDGHGFLQHNVYYMKRVETK